MQVLQIDLIEEYQKSSPVPMQKPVLDSQVQQEELDININQFKLPKGLKQAIERLIDTRVKEYVDQKLIELNLMPEPKSKSHVEVQIPKEKEDEIMRDQIN